ncbi:MAG: hypothetical protein ACWGQW_04875 [bacterium]
MSVTPIFSLRVPPEKLEEWRAACAHNNVTISNQIRILMDAWVKVENLRAQSELDEHEQHMSLLNEAKKLLAEINS